MAKTPAEIRSLARSHGPKAIKVLAGIMNQPKAPEAARVAAARELLDRGIGKSTQIIAGDPDGAPIASVTRIERVIVEASHAPQSEALEDER